LKAEIPADALKYAKLCNRPDFIAEAYFENNQFEKCLTYYMALTQPYTIYPGWIWSPSDTLSRNRLPNVAKSFYFLINKYPKKYNFENIQENYGWLYNQVISRFGSLEDAFSYYEIYSKPSSEKKEKRQILKKSRGESVNKNINEILEIHQAFKKVYFQKLDILRGLLEQGNFKTVKDELINLYKKYKELEAETGSKIIGNIIKTVDADLITDISEIYLINGEIEEALSWILKLIDEHWRYVGYYINLKFLLNRDLEGDDFIRIGFSASFRNNVGSIRSKDFYKPSMFAKRNIEDMVTISKVNVLKCKNDIGSGFLGYLSGKYVNKELPLGRYGSDASLYRHIHALFGGKYGKYRIDHDLTMQSIKDNVNINPEALHGIEKSWVHIAFDSCHELIQLISDLCTNCENQLRREKGIPEIGCQWKSETEIYAFIKELFVDYEVFRHHSPSWLAPMHLDVYVPELRLAIEYQGQQHYVPVNIFGGQEGFEKTKVRDTIKKKLCQKNKVYLLCIRHDDEEPEKTIAKFIEKKWKI
jgi:hypothetical protein